MNEKKKLQFKNELLAVIGKYFGLENVIGYDSKLEITPSNHLTLDGVDCHFEVNFQLLTMEKEQGK